MPTGLVQHGSGRRRLASNILWLYILQGLNYITPLVVLPYLVRVLGMEMYGLIAFAQSFAQYFTSLTDYGFNFSATRSIAKKIEDHEAVSRIFCSVLVIKIAFTIAGALILVAVVSLVPRFHQNSALFFVGYAAVVGNVLFPLWYFQGIEQMRYISGVIGISRLLGALALFGFVHHPTDALLALAIQSAVPVSGGIVGLWIVFGRFKLHLFKPTASDLKIELAEGWHLFISTAAISLYTNTNVFLVGLLAGDLQAGYFSVAEKVVRATQGLIGPLAQAMFPHMNSLMARSQDLALRFAARALRWVGVISAFGCLMILCLARPMTLLFFGRGAVGSIPIIRWIAFVPFFVAVSNILAVQTMIPFGLDKQLSRITILAGLFNVACAALLIGFYGAKGAGISVFFTELFVSVAAGFVLSRHKIRIPLLELSVQ